MNTRRLIINADDFGWDDDTTTVTGALIEAGAISSATIMTGRPATARAIAFALAHASEKVSFGLHFNIADGHVPHGSSSASLVDESGRLRASNPQRIQALLGRLKPRDIAAELEAQLVILLDHGIRVSHVDSHGHLHKFPAVFRAMKPVLARFGIERVRRPQTLPRVRLAPNMLLNDYCALAFRGARTTDAFAYMDAGKPGWLEALCTMMPSGTTELSVHPGTSDAWRRDEADGLRDARACAGRHGIELVSFWAI